MGNKKKNGVQEHMLQDAIAFDAGNYTRTVFGCQEPFSTFLKKH